MGDAVKKALHIPDNIAPLMATLTEVKVTLQRWWSQSQPHHCPSLHAQNPFTQLTATGAKFAQGEGSAEAAAGVVDKLKQLSKHVDGMEEGPLRKMVMGLKNEAVGKLQGVSGPGVDKILAILAIIGTSESGKVDEIAASAPTPAAATPAAPEATPAAPSTAPAVPEPAAPAEPVAVVAAEST